MAYDYPTVSAIPMPRRPLLVLEGKPTRYREVSLTVETQRVDVGSPYPHYAPSPGVLAITLPDGTVESRRYRHHRYTRRRSGRALWEFNEPVRAQS